MAAFRAWRLAVHMSATVCLDSSICQGLSGSSSTFLGKNIATFFKQHSVEACGCVVCSDR